MVNNNGHYITTEGGDKRKLYCNCNSDYVKSMETNLRDLPEELLFCARCKLFCWFYPDNAKGNALQIKIRKVKRKEGKAIIEPDLYFGKPFNGGGNASKR